MPLFEFFHICFQFFDDPAHFFLFWQIVQFYLISRGCKPFAEIAAVNFLSHAREVSTLGLRVIALGHWN